METTIGIEAARGRLGALCELATEAATPVVLTRRGRASAVLLDLEEYLRFKEAAAREARAALTDLLSEIREQVEHAGLDSSLVRQAAEALHRLE